jgi:hypothetical protein
MALPRLAIPSFARPPMELQDRRTLIPASLAAEPPERELPGWPNRKDQRRVLASRSFILPGPEASSGRRPALLLANGASDRAARGARIGASEDGVLCALRLSDGSYSSAPSSPTG